MDQNPPTYPLLYCWIKTLLAIPLLYAYIVSPQRSGITSVADILFGESLTLYDCCLRKLQPQELAIGRWTMT